MKNFLALCILFLSCEFFAQSPAIQWAKTFGNTSYDLGYSVKETPDGGFIVTGWGSGSHACEDLIVIKLDSTGAAQWTGYYGGSGSDEGAYIELTKDGGYIVGGSTRSWNDGDVSGMACSYGADAWVIKLNSQGTIQWQQCLGACISDESVNKIHQTADGGYILASYTSSDGGEVSGFHDNAGHNAGPDMWVVKLDSAGTVQWEKCLGGTGNEMCWDARELPNGNFVAIGSTDSGDGDVTDHHGIYGNDLWIVQLDTTGNIVSKRCYGSTGGEEAFDCQIMNDGGLILVGNHGGAMDGDVTDTIGGSDIWMLRLDTSGNILWQKSHGGSGAEFGYSIKRTIDGGFVIGGISRSTDGEVTGYHPSSIGDYDFWIVKTDSVGGLQWQKTLGGSGDEMCWEVAETSKGDFIAVGYTDSHDGDVTGLHGNVYEDFWVVKLTRPSLNDIQSLEKNSITLTPNPSSGSFKINSSSEGTLILTDLQGRIVESWNLRNALDCEFRTELGSGSYLYHFTTSTGTSSGKLAIGK